MPVFRVTKDKNFTVMSNHHLRDPALSLKAKGLLSLMLSLSPNWEYSLSGLAAISREGKDAVRTAIRELERGGYLRRFRLKNQDGSFSHNEYRIYEHPGVCPPSSENPAMENPTELNKDKITDSHKEEYEEWL